MQQGFFPDANKIIKYQDSSNFWIFKAGKRVYKVKKLTENNSSIPLDELFCSELSRLTQTHSPELDLLQIEVKKDGDEYLIDLDGSIAAPVLYYGVSMNQLADRYFLKKIIEKGKVSDKIMKQIAEFLFRFHEATPSSTSKEDGTPEQLRAKIQNLYYQSKKHLGETISQPVIDMTLRPLERFLEEHRKLLLRRIKKGCIKQVHGGFVPRKIHVSKEGVFALGKTTEPLRDRFQDVVADMADLVVELSYHEQKKFANSFVAKYSKMSGDREIKQLLPFYQAIRCLTCGLNHSIAMESTTGAAAEEFRATAIKYYEQTVEAVRLF
ncbi:MAG: hypothetical protein COB67_01400 [SAR324 cluster bacterium]|uniref:Aminoglycoside phosphotransferase domain-containing protein n=1 Tax=SAR324 cluster bacterium TaxID=2024889 RepID=A0A2A4TAS1_9DELT|nr:MAG: hypothetical protein COB67_01400 [SAR324 cluster bacterium]